MSLKEKLSPAEVKQKAREVQRLAPTPEFVNFRQDLFKNIDAACVESGAIARLHRMVEEEGRSDITMVTFDTAELAVGAGFPFPGRYIIPIPTTELSAWGANESTDEEFEEAMKDVKIPDFVPGLVIRTYPAGMTRIQVGIDYKAEVHKVFARLNTVSHHWRDGNSFARPYWLPENTVRVEDVTQQYDFEIVSNLAVALIYADDMDTGLSYFTAGGRDYSSNVSGVDFSVEERASKETVVVWHNKENQRKVDEAFAYMETFFSDKSTSEPQN